MSRTDAKPPKQRPPTQTTLAGIPVSPGIVIGTVYAASEPKLEVSRGSIAVDAVAAELQRLDAAVQKSRRQLGKLRARLSVLPEESQHEIAPLIDAYLQMLGPLAPAARRPPAHRRGVGDGGNGGAGRGRSAGGGHAGHRHARPSA